MLINELPKNGKPDRRAGLPVRALSETLIIHRQSKVCKVIRKEFGNRRWPPDPSLLHHCLLPRLSAYPRSIELPRR